MAVKNSLKKIFVNKKTRRLIWRIKKVKKKFWNRYLSKANSTISRKRVVEVKSIYKDAFNKNLGRLKKYYDHPDDDFTTIKIHKHLIRMNKEDIEETLRFFVKELKNMNQPNAERMSSDLIECEEFFLIKRMHKFCYRKDKFDWNFSFAKNLMLSSRDVLKFYEYYNYSEIGLARWHNKVSKKSLNKLNTNNELKRKTIDFHPMEETFKQKREWRKIRKYLLIHEDKTKHEFIKNKEERVQNFLPEYEDTLREIFRFIEYGNSFLLNKVFLEFNKIHKNAENINLDNRNFKRQLLYIFQEIENKNRRNVFLKRWQYIIDLYLQELFDYYVETQVVDYSKMNELTWIYRRIKRRYRNEKGYKKVEKAMQELIDW
ncbi:hypothetical protein ACA758_00160 [Mycoplasmopsis agassizii]|uniref:hypothetical protein n=1 Tax=Mycoplasmopsis agassizii TaxID=33922 RepID=UPI00352932ED